MIYYCMRIVAVTYAVTAFNIAVTAITTTLFEGVVTDAVMLSLT